MPRLVKLLVYARAPRSNFAGAISRLIRNNL
jgi:hypothetical protein